MKWFQQVVLFILIFTLFKLGLSKSNKQRLKLERVEVEYFNPKYIKDVKCFTFRERRGDYYKTNLCYTILHTWGNNMSMEIYYKNKKSSSPLLLFKQKLCDLFAVKWINHFLVKYYQEDLVCPFAAGTYHATNVTLFQEEIPLDFPRGVNYIGVMAKDHRDVLVANIMGTLNIP